MSANAGSLTLLVDSTSVTDGERVLNSFERTGAKTERNVKANMAQVEQAMKRLGQQSKSTEETASMLSRGFEKLGIEASGARMGMRMLPYQLNQIAQSGAVTGRWMTSITTQIPDILAGFGSMQLVLAGGAAAMAAAFIPALVGTSSSIEDLAKKIEDAEDALDQYKSAAELAAMTTTQLEERFGSAGKSMRSLLSVIEDLKQREGQHAIDALSESVSELLAVAGDGEKRSAIADFFDVNIFLAFTDKARDARKVARELTGDFLGAQRALEYASTIEDGTKRLDAQIVASERLLNASIGLAEADGKRTKEEDKFIAKVADSLKKMRLLRGAVEDTERAEEKKSEAAAEIVSKYERQAEMAIAIATFGKDSAQVEALKRAEAIRTAQAMVDQAGLSGDVAQNVLNAANAAFDAEANSARAAAALRDAEEAARALASAVASAAGFSLSLDNGIRVLEAEIRALERGADGAIASIIETKRLRAEQAYQDQIAAGQDWVIANARRATDLAQIARQEELLKQKKGLTSATKKAAKAGARATKETERQLDAIRASIDPFHSYNKKMKELVALKKHLSDDEMAMAIKNLNMELADSLPLVGELSDAIAGAIVAGDSLSDAFANVLRQMAQDALSSGIKAILTDQLTPGTGGGGFFGTILGGLLGKTGATEAEAVTQMAGSTKKTDWFNPPLIANSTDIPKSFKPQTVNNTSSNQTVLTVVVDVTGANGDEAVKKIAEEATRKGIEQAAPKLIGQSVDATYERSAEYPLGKRRK
ncbi:hypothetical protein ACSSNL_13325 [Thalassobius sp. S69A]|uniref:hypothetical protein n=1 Tax=unclassified Thalassovita TaxID=2619711 RepID=UPI003C7A66A3